MAFTRKCVLPLFTMYFAVVWTFLFSISLLAALPGEGPGLQEHPGGYSGVVRDRLNHHWSSAISKYFWYIKDYTGEFSKSLDWSLGMMFHEEIKDEQGLNYETETELRQKRLSKVGELVVIVMMSTACLTVIRLTIRKLKGFYRKY
ncbi:uncharacterized protein LOC144637165 [Oculina patagonica]